MIHQDSWRIFDTSFISATTRGVLSIRGWKKTCLKINISPFITIQTGIGSICQYEVYLAGQKSYENLSYERFKINSLCSIMFTHLHLYLQHFDQCSYGEKLHRISIKNLFYYYSNTIHVSICSFQHGNVFRMDALWIYLIQPCLFIHKYLKEILPTYYGICFGKCRTFCRLRQ